MIPKWALLWTRLPVKIPPYPKRDEIEDPSKLYNAVKAYIAGDKSLLVEYLKDVEEKQNRSLTRR